MRIEVSDGWITVFGKELEVSDGDDVFRLRQLVAKAEAGGISLGSVGVVPREPYLVFNRQRVELDVVKKILLELGIDPTTLVIEQV